ncbi:nicotinate (nicotinamide) nucleotide adenylyltransferase [soil metagenome]
MNIGLYFGSFNPVHTGHLIIASHFANYHHFQQVWLVVSPRNPLKESKNLLNENHRKHMIDLAIEGEYKLRSSNAEFNLPRPSFTIDTLTYLTETYPQHQFSILMGSDSLSNLSKWKNYEVLLKNFSLYVYERPGFALISLPGSRIVTTKAPLLDISSTRIREMIKEGKSVRYLVPDVVMEEIHAQQYYRN